MCDIFLCKDVIELLKNKSVLMMGDSNMRSFYKDLMYLISHNDVALSTYFRKHGPKSVCGDRVISYNERTSGRDFYESREFQEKGIHLRYEFLTKIYGPSMKTIINQLESGTIPVPDVIVMNSCLWDITRWGPKKEKDYMESMTALFSDLDRILPKKVLKIWTTTLPSSVTLIKGGVVIEQLQFTKHTMRFMILEANQFAQKLCLQYGFDLLDLHYHMRFQLHRRTIDGIHWETQALRHIVCLLLTHICIALGKSLPGNLQTGYLENTLEIANVPAYSSNSGTNGPDYQNPQPSTSNVNNTRPSPRAIKRARRRCRDTKNPQPTNPRRDLRQVISTRPSRQDVVPLMNNRPMRGPTNWDNRMSYSPNHGRGYPHIPHPWDVGQGPQPHRHWGSQGFFHDDRTFNDYYEF